MLVLAMVGETPTPALTTLTLVIATVAALMDAVDGAMARRACQTSAFGARFDMETDALLILALSVLAWNWDKAGAWILLAGLARYLFVACAAVAPFTNLELPPSRRRQAVCVIQVVTLLLCIAPWIPSPVSDLAAGSGLIALIYSFTVDVRWLFRSARLPTATRGIPMTISHTSATASTPGTLIRIACFVILAAAAGQSFAESKRYKLDPEHLSIGFLVDHIGYAKVPGMFRKAEGSFVFDEDTGVLGDIRIEVDAASVFSNHRKRDEHLKSADFLNASEFPTLVFTASSAKPAQGKTYRIEGQLKLLGESRPVTLDATWNKSGEYPFGGNPYAMGISARGHVSPQ